MSTLLSSQKEEEEEEEEDIAVPCGSIRPTRSTITLSSLLGKMGIESFNIKWGFLYVVYYLSSSLNYKHR
jgi:hypothetical protein